MRLTSLLLLILLTLPAPATTTADGVYTARQAERGKVVYRKECASCHATNLRGAEGGTPLLGATFLSKWNGKSLQALFSYLRTTMPPGRTGSLSDKAYSSLLAYLLQQNGSPTGRGALPTRETELATIQITATRSHIEVAMPTEPNNQINNAPGEWRYYGGGPGSQRYSPLALIDRDNVDDLEMVWRWKANNFGPTPEFNYRATPLMIGRTLYVTAGQRRAVAAIDAATGETLWTYRINEGERGEHAPRQNSGRGVAYWEKGEDRRVLLVTPGFQLIALDAGTGLPIVSFGTDGKVDLKLGLDRDLDPVTTPIGSTSPPIVVGDVAIVGSALPAGFGPPSAIMPPGHVRGYDVRSGERRWIFHTIPHPGEFGYETWPADEWKTEGNVAVWTTMSADPDLGYVYLPLEAATHDHYGGHRLGENLFSQSLVCLDARTGKRVWHFQTVHHGIWDYDLPTAPVLLDIEVNGRQIPAVMQLTKQAFTFVFDRRNGEPVWPIEERPVPQSDVPGEKTAATQPFPTRPSPFSRQGISEQDLIDFTPALRAEAVTILSRYRTGPLYTPPSLIYENGTQGTLMLPNQGGGANWPGGAADPESGFLYVGSSSWPAPMALAPDPELSSLPFVAVGNPMFDEGPQGLPLIKPPWGTITAINMNTGEHVWQVANGEAHDSVRNHPALAGLDIPRTGRPERAGLLVTKTLLFAGEGGGLYATQKSGGPMFRAHDKATGEILAELKLPGNQTGLPMSYAVDGRQFIVIAVGASKHPGELVALSIP